MMTQTWSHKRHELYRMSNIFKVRGCYYQRKGKRNTGRQISDVYYFCASKAPCASFCHSTYHIRIDCFFTFQDCIHVSDSFLYSQHISQDVTWISCSKSAGSWNECIFCCNCKGLCYSIYSKYSKYREK